MIQLFAILNFSIFYFRKQVIVGDRVLGSKFEIGVNTNRTDSDYPLKKTAFDFDGFDGFYSKNKVRRKLETSCTSKRLKFVQNRHFSFIRESMAGSPHT